MLADILGTSWDQCWNTVQYNFMSTETRRLVRMDSPGRPPWLSHSSWTMSYVWCYLSFIVAQSSLLNFRTLCCSQYSTRGPPEEWWPMTISDLEQFQDFIKLMFHPCVHTSAWKKRRLVELNINFDCGIIRFLVLQLVDGLNNVLKHQEIQLLHVF